MLEKGSGTAACTTAQLSHAFMQCVLLQRNEVPASSALFLQGDEGLLARRDIPQLQGAASAFFLPSFPLGSPAQGSPASV